MIAPPRGPMFWPFLLGLPLLVWPAVLNGYPIVFSDTGTYLSQAIHLYAGWDRPVFYSLFMMALHWTLSTWPVVLAQAVIVIWLLDRARVAFFPAVPRVWLAVLLGVLSLTTGLPWLVSRLTPDLFTPLLVLALAILIFAPEALARREHALLLLAALAMILVHQSHVPLAIGLIALMLPLRRVLGARIRLGRAALASVLALPAVALAMLSAVNFAAHGRLSPSPFGSVFLLARVMYDGPGLRTLARECPRAGWRLCAHLDALPGNSDDFLWRADSPLNRIGGAKVVADEAGAIILATVRSEPGAQLRAMLDNTLQQLRLFSPSDGLQSWTMTVSPWIARDFPGFEQRAYASARQDRGDLSLPAWTELTDHATSLLGLAGLLALLLHAVPRGNPRAGLAVMVLLAVLGNAVITGGLSGPHDRYQSRVMWLPAAIVLLALPGAGRWGLRAGRAAWRVSAADAWLSRRTQVRHHVVV